MFKILSWLVFLCIVSQPFQISSQNNEVFLMDIEFSDEDFSVSNVKNISNNEGYDNQPSFVNNDRVLYAGTENGQTEIQVYYLEDGRKFRINKSTSGGEYSPTHFPQSNRIAAVRLDTTGLQRLYAYDYNAPGYGESTLLLNDLEVAYFAFYDEKTILASILSDGNLDLVLVDLKTKKITPYLENTGRSIHKIPQRNAMSYTAINEEGNMDVYQLDMASKESYFICQLPVGIQDHTWLNESNLLLGSGDKLYRYDLYGSGDWKEVADLSMYEIDNISRLATSKDGK
ncbi:MAG: hypothetical protein HKM28_02755 [Flavobacteriaceae bacterium]|nr:hypothetical protein [Flavobacteriaceae bacterium]